MDHIEKALTFRHFPPAACSPLKWKLVFISIDITSIGMVIILGSWFILVIFQGKILSKLAYDVIITSHDQVSNFKLFQSSKWKYEHYDILLQDPGDGFSPHPYFYDMRLQLLDIFHWYWCKMLEVLGRFSQQTFEHLHTRCITRPSVAPCIDWRTPVALQVEGPM